jgi:hypothetical protein
MAGSFGLNGYVQPFRADGAGNLAKSDHRAKDSEVIIRPVGFDARVMIRGLVLPVTAFLLLTYGGAIVAAPVSLPLLAWTARTSPSRWVGAAAAVVAGLTATEVAWAAFYVTIGERSPWIVAVPVAVGMIVTVWFLRWTRR